MDYIFLITFIGGMVYAFVHNVNYYSGLYEDDQRREREQRRREYERIAAQEKKNQTEYIELSKQLDGIRYQLRLLEKLDNFRSDNLTDEKEIKKALALEKQYNTLYQKERKLKRKLNEIRKTPE